MQMTNRDRTKWTGIALVASLVFVNALLWAGVDADSLGFTLVLIAAPPTTLFVILYMFTARWWETWIGVALLTSSTGMAGLIDLSLAFQLFGDNYALRDHARITVFMFVVYGGILKLVALLIDKLEQRHADEQVPDEQIPRA